MEGRPQKSSETNRGGRGRRGRGRGPRQAKPRGFGGIVPDQDLKAEPGRTARFQGSRQGNQYEELKSLRDRERKDAIAKGLIDDPSKPKQLHHALTFIGTCQDMCPLFEREQREYQNNVDRFEIDPSTGRIDQAFAVKAYHRPAAGNEQALPSDVRPPKVLRATMDYLVDRIVSGKEPLQASHFFVRDRTRSVRQDFTLQNERGPEAIECHERIARYHILCLHQLCETVGFSEQQEMEQLRKVLHSLTEFYEDLRNDGVESVNEAEFRAYNILTHLRDPDIGRQALGLPMPILLSRHVQQALKLSALAQRNNERVGNLLPVNTEAAQNLFSRFFKEVRSPRTSYLAACIAESHFPSIRQGALKAMRRTYLAAHKPFPISDISRLLGFDSAQEAAENCENYGIDVNQADNGHFLAAGLNRSSAWDDTSRPMRHTFSQLLVENKRGHSSFREVINGSVYSSQHVPNDIGRPSRPQNLSRLNPKARSFELPTTKKPTQTVNGGSGATFKTKAPDHEFRPIQLTKPSQWPKSAAGFGTLNQKTPLAPFEKPVDLARPGAPPSKASFETGIQPSKHSLKDSTFSPGHPSVPEPGIGHAVKQEQIYESAISSVSRRILAGLKKEIIFDLASEAIADVHYVRNTSIRFFRKFTRAAQKRLDARLEHERLIAEQLEKKRQHRVALRNIANKPLQNQKSAGAGPLGLMNFGGHARPNINSEGEDEFWRPIDRRSVFAPMRITANKKGLSEVTTLVYDLPEWSTAGHWLDVKLAMQPIGMAFHSQVEIDGVTCSIKRFPQQDPDLQKTLQQPTLSAVIVNVTLSSDKKDTIATSLSGFLTMLSERAMYRVPVLIMCWLGSDTDANEVSNLLRLENILNDANLAVSAVHLLTVETRSDAKLEPALRAMFESVSTELAPRFNYRQLEESRKRNVQEEARLESEASAKHRRMRAKGKLHRDVFHHFPANETAVKGPNDYISDDISVQTSNDIDELRGSILKARGLLQLDA